MDYNLLLDVTTELGYRLAMNGAETFRIEESINRVMAAYGIEAEVFAIPNCLHVSIQADTGQPITRMRRIGHHGNNLDAVEQYSNLSRKLCAETPAPEIAMSWLEQTHNQARKYSLGVYLAGNFLGSCGFSVLFGAGLVDSLCAGICGMIIGLIVRFMDNQKVNPFFKTIAASFVMAIFAYLAGYSGIVKNVDTAIIGALMILVPGLIFTNAMRDIIYGDTNSGMNRIVQVFLTAAAIALGTGAAWKASVLLFGQPAVLPVTDHALVVQVMACFIGCIGFSILFNIHGIGGLLCAFGGVLAWLTYRLIFQYTGDDIAAYFWGAAVAALYSEIMARVRKYPAISYLVVSVFPLIPGAGVYYAMRYAVNGDLASFGQQGVHTAAIAGVMAVGILLVSTAVRLINIWLLKNRSKRSRV